MRVCLDCCSIQRPFDDKSHPRIAVEAEAVLVILSLCESGQVQLVSSEALVYEIDRIPDQVRREEALTILKMSREQVDLTPELEGLARKLITTGLKPLDALHLASASIAKTDYFCTCDDKFLKKARNIAGLNTVVVSPTELVMELDI